MNDSQVKSTNDTKMINRLASPPLGTKLSPTKTNRKSASKFESSGSLTQLKAISGSKIVARSSRNSLNKPTYASVGCNAKKNSILRAKSTDAAPSIPRRIRSGEVKLSITSKKQINKKVSFNIFSIHSGYSEMSSQQNAVWSVKPACKDTPPRLPLSSSEENKMTCMDVINFSPREGSRHCRSGKSYLALSLFANIRLHSSTSLNKTNETKTNSANLGRRPI